MRGTRRFLSAVLVAFALAPATALAATPEYFPLPGNRPMSTGIVADPDGNVWFAAGTVSPETVPPIGRLVPGAASPGTSNGIAIFPTPAIAGEPCCANFIRDVAFDNVNGRVWFIRSTGVFGYGVPVSMSPGTSNGMQAAATNPFMDLGGIAVAPNGTAWLTEYSAFNTGLYPGNRVASTGVGLGIHELPSLAHQTPVFDGTRYDAKPKGITIDKDGAPWFAEASPGLPGYRVAKVAGEGYQEYLLTPCGPGSPCSGSNVGTGPTSVAAAPDGSIWFTNELKNTFGRLNPGDATIAQYSLPSIDPQLASGQPRSIRLAQDGTLWLAEFGYISHPSANAIVRIVPGDPPTATVYHLGAGKTPYSVAPDTKGNVWFGVTSDSSTGFVGRLAGVVGAAAQPGGPPPTPGTVVKPATVGVAKVGDPTVKASSLSANQICVGPPEARCSLVFLIQTHEYVTGFPGTKAQVSRAKKKKRRTRVVTVGRKTVTLAGGKSAKVVVKLNAKGRKILQRDGRLATTFTVTQKLSGGKKKTLKSKKVTFKAKKKAKKKR